MKAIALATVHYDDERTKERKVAYARGSMVDGVKQHGVFDGLASAEFVKLEKLGAVRLPTKGELADADESDVPEPVVIEAAPADDEPELTPKHVGAGKYVVVNKAGDVVSGEEKLDGKDAALKWIADKATEDEIG